MKVNVSKESRWKKFIIIEKKIELQPKILSFNVDSGSESLSKYLIFAGFPERVCRIDSESYA